MEPLLALLTLLFCMTGLGPAISWFFFFLAGASSVSASGPALLEPLLALPTSLFCMTGLGPAVSCFFFLAGASTISASGPTSNLLLLEPLLALPTLFRGMTGQAMDAAASDRGTSMSLRTSNGMGPG